MFKRFLRKSRQSTIEFADLYRKSGKTSKGRPRWRCKACLKTSAPGTRLGRQKRSHTNREVLWMITNRVAITKICDVTELSPRDVYRKIGFIHERSVDFKAKREANFNRVSWNEVGRHFASVSQTLHLNWPNKRMTANDTVTQLFYNKPSLPRTARTLVFAETANCGRALFGNEGPKIIREKKSANNW